MSALIAVILLASPGLEDRWISVGPTAGLRLLDAEKQAFMLGGELSVIWADTGGEWQGIYFDGAYCPDLDLVQGGMGVELGWSIIGMDAGLVVDHTPTERFEWGARLRALATIGLASAYAGFGSVSGPRGAFAELGVMAKLPIPY